MDGVKAFVVSGEGVVGTVDNKEPLPFKSRKGRLVQKSLMDAAINLIAKKGLEQLSVGELCSRVGLKRTSFYTHYPSISDFIDALAQREYDRFDDAMKAIHALEGPGLKALVTSVLEVYTLKDVEHDWLLFVLQLIVSHKKTRERFKDDIRADVVAALRDGDFSIPDGMIEPFVHLVAASIKSAMTPDNSHVTDPTLGVKMIELILQAGGCERSLREIIEVE